MDKQWIPTVAGVLEILSGVSSALGAFFLAFSGAFLNWIPDVKNDPDVPLGVVTTLVGALAVLLFVGALICFVGGVAGLRRRGWGWAIAGAVASIFLLPPAGVIALILVIVGEKEFADRSAAVEAATG